MYKRSKQLGAGYFIVEISSTNTHLNIAAFDVESPESLLIELPEKTLTSFTSTSVAINFPAVKVPVVVIPSAPKVRVPFPLVPDPS